MEKEKVIQHQGRNVKFFRNARLMKQDVFAKMVGMDQSNVPKLERRKLIEDETLIKCANVLGVSVEILKDLDLEKTLQSLAGNNITIEKIESGSVGVNLDGVGIGENHVNPIEKIMELNKQNTELYERMLKAEQEKNAMLEQRIVELKGK